MKALTLPLCKQQGFTLLESLVALVIFSIIILGSGVATSRMLNVQKNMNVDFVILNMMQNKMQNALSSTTGSNVCNAINLDSFVLANTTYYMACGTEKIEIDSTVVEWPVLAVSAVSSKATSCANGSADDSCYVVGR